MSLGKKFMEFVYQSYPELVDFSYVLLHGLTVGPKITCAGCLSAGPMEREVLATSRLLRVAKYNNDLSIVGFLHFCLTDNYRVKILTEPPRLPQYQPVCGSWIMIKIPKLI